MPRRAHPEGRWSDVDLDARVAMIGQQRIANGRLVTVGPPKTAASRRPPGRRVGAAIVRLHDLRDGAARLAHCAGVDLKTVQAQPGHSSIALTADTYTSVLTDLFTYAAEATAKLVLAAEASNPGRQHRRTDHPAKSAAPAATRNAASRSCFRPLASGSSSWPGQR
jgi:hypothetical protein